MEEGEAQIDTAYREIWEETSIRKNQLKYIDFCTSIKYTFEKDGAQNNKEVYVNVFESLEKNVLTPEEDQDEILDVRWFDYDEALKTIAFNKEELIKSKAIFEKYLKK